jgi:hypothetical protein
LKTSRKPKRKATTRTPAPRKARSRAPRRPAARRADFGAPIESYFARQPAQLRDLLEALRKLVEETAPEATASIKWGQPFYEIGGEMMCALTAHRSHVNLVLAGPQGAFADPGGLLEGEGKTGRHLTLRSGDALPADAVRGWIRTAAQIARLKAARR